MKIKSFLSAVSVPIYLIIAAFGASGRAPAAGNLPAFPQEANSSVLIENLTWVEAEKALKNYEVVLIALGARSKEHGPHLPLDTDFILAEYLRDEVMREVPVAVLPTIAYGYYPSFLEYPGSLSIGRETFRDFVIDLCRSIAGYGIRKFYILNFGISTKLPLGDAKAELEKSGLILWYTGQAAAKERLPAGLLEQEGGTHADEEETSMMLYVAPGRVDMTKAVKDFDPRPGRRGLTRDPKGAGNYSPTGIYGDPTLATREKGRTIVETTIRGIVREVRELIALKLQTGPARKIPTIREGPSR
jgi:creatinine amidohydrolase